MNSGPRTQNDMWEEDLSNSVLGNTIQEEPEESEASTKETEEKNEESEEGGE